MKKKLLIDEKKLAGFTAMAGAVIAGSTADAQIVYTDVNPDVVVDVNNPAYDLDFNTDAITDASFLVNSIAVTTSYNGIPVTYNGSYAVAYPVAGGGLQMSLVPGSSSSSMTSAVAPLNNGDAINPAAMFTSSAGLLALDLIINAPLLGYTSYQYQGGEFLGVSDKFLGVKFVAGVTTHYGWVRLDVAADASSITIKDYAYNQFPDGEILAGQMVGLENIAVDEKVTVKTTLNEALINVTPDLIGGTVNMYNMSGQLVASTSIQDVDTKLSFEGIETGIYTVAAQFDAGQVTKKVYVK
jgi:hypothetical protein